MTKEILLNIIRQLNEIGFDMRGVVSDMGPTNRKLWNELDISIEKPYFIHPESETKRVPTHLLRMFHTYLN